MRNRIFFALSVIIHVGLAELLRQTDGLAPRRDPNKQVLEVRSVRHEDLERRLKRALAAQEKTTPVVVSQDPNLALPQEGALKDREYLGARNQRVDRNLRAARSGKFQNVEGAQGEKKLMTFFKLPTRAVDREQHEAVRAKTGKLISNRQPASVGSESAEPRGNGYSQTSDVLEDVELGPMTLLNTKEYMFYGFYERLKTQVVEHWYALVESAMEDWIRKDPSQSPAVELRTKLLAYVSPQGEIQELKLVGSSGSHELDRAALEAFRRAAPFPNVPTQLMQQEKDSLGRLPIVWNFVVSHEATAGLRFRMNRVRIR